MFFFIWSDFDHVTSRDVTFSHLTIFGYLSKLSGKTVALIYTLLENPYDMLKSIILASQKSQQNDKIPFRTHSIGNLIIYGIFGKISNFDDVIKALWRQS